MGVIRVLHNENYTTMANYHLRDDRLSLRAMGLMSKMLSLPDDWDYTVAGLAAICKEGREAVRKVLMELEEAGYLERDQSREGGRFSGYDYTLHEEPIRRTEEEQKPEAADPPLPEPEGTDCHASATAQQSFKCHTLPARQSVRNDGESPLPRNPGDGGPPLPKNPLPRNPLPENPPQLNNLITKERKNKNTGVPIPLWMPKDVCDAIIAYCEPDTELLAAWMGYAEMRHRIKKAVATVDTVTRSCSTLDRLSKGSRAYKIGMLHKATDHSWRGLFPLEAGDEGFAPGPAAPPGEEAELWF